MFTAYVVDEKIKINTLGFNSILYKLMCFTTNSLALTKVGTKGILDDFLYCLGLQAIQMIVIDISLLSCQPRVTVTSCFVYKVIWDLELIYHLCINPIHRIGLIHK